ncbi:NAD(P)/FAD-dependent oxidoreductase [Pseudomonadales bacterium]|nr:NAD(P)/FAD-dependent oxidoreductase [Pseudomonadales bacterium]MDA8880085.1 NAD(P)/FAD-dependent oxidoreductase [Pseudomonadales bacterium]|tara:strand:- start:1662 stop:3296 length:1635 start_codon:yes stop_codon:yes gene_type:complete
MNKSNPKTSSDNYDVVVVGAGFSGMYLVKKLRDLGLNFVILEQGGDVGGTWYWNRYPGARCDIPTVEYSYSFDKELEQSWDWQELMAAQPEILTYANQVADNYDLRDSMRFNTRVASADFDENEHSWTLVTDTGDEYLARYFIMATGCLSVPNWPDIEGREDYAGRTIHTGLWPHEKVDFTGLRVGIIGTGSSAVQSIPEIAKTAKELKVFQRTPVYTFPAGNHPLDDDFRADIKARYEDIRETQRGSLGGMAMFGVMGRLQEVGTEKIADCSEEEREQRLVEEGLPSLRRYADVGLDLEANEMACDLYRRHIADIIDDPETAKALMPRGYPMGCKRQVVDIGYYEAFNRDNVSLIDLREDPIERINESGVCTAGGQHDVDVLIYATGFDAMTGAINNVSITGRSGTKLKEKWENGPRSYLGLQIAGFPNLFTVTGPGSPSVLSNMLVSIEQHCDWITDCIHHMNSNGLNTIEAEQQAEDQWVKHVFEVADGTMLTAPSCSSWYLGVNIPGKPRVFMPYVGGVGNYRAKCSSVAANGYEGFKLG